MCIRDRSTARDRDNGGAIVNGGRMDAKTFYSVAASGTTGVLSNYVYSATNVRLRELSLSYTLPALARERLRITLSLIANNVLMLHNLSLIHIYICKTAAAHRNKALGPEIFVGIVRRTERQLSAAQLHFFVGFEHDLLLRVGKGTHPDAAAHERRREYIVPLVSIDVEARAEHLNLTGERDVYKRQVR